MTVEDKQLKVVEGVFAPVHYNTCEAGCPLGILTKWDTPDVLCDLVKEAFGLSYTLDDGRYPSHPFIGKRVKITIEIYDSSLTTITTQESKGEQS